MTAWSAEALARIAAAAELEIAVRRPGGTYRPPVPVWVVTVAGEVYVRSWYRRDTGWFGAAIASAHAHIRVPGAKADVTVTDVGDGDGDERLRAEVDDAYRAKYGAAGAASMVTSAAAATPLRLRPRRAPR
ncbi:DUF2255 family protein [Dactylosporangium sp. CA-052675]|uniref:DUF2255 family protein n=1 Tax=Dactylosporangium sp. CA-052675 TaxID=3239927 RepID=UPI003D90A8F5